MTISSRDLRLVLACFYLALLFTGACTISLRSCTVSHEPRYLAARDLAANHRLQPGDLAVPDGVPEAIAARWPSLNDRYLIADIGAKKPVSPRDTLPLPRLRGSAGMSYVALEVTPPQSRFLDVGTPIRISTKDGALYSNRVVAIVPEGTKTYILVWMPDAQVKARAFDGATVTVGR